MRIEAVKEISRLIELKDDWNGMLEEYKLVTPFTVFEWIYSCADCFGSGKELFVLVVRDDETGQINGIAPFWLRKVERYGVSVRELAFITCPDTPSIDFILRPGMESAVLIEIFSHLLGEGNPGWDLLALEKIPAQSTSLETINDYVDRNWIRHFKGYPQNNSYIDINMDWNSFLKGRSERFRKTRRNIANKWEKMTSIAIEKHESDPEGRLMDMVLEVSKKGWKAADGLAITSREDFTRFFGQLTRWAAEKNMLYVWLLKMDGVPVAMEYDLRHKGIVYALRSDFDEVKKDLSPGTFLEYRLIEQLFREGFREYNMGPGANEYKTHWTDSAAKHLNLFFCNRTWKGRSVWEIANRIYPCLRKIKQSFQFKAVEARSKPSE